MLKTGTRIEGRRLREVDAPVKWLAFDAVTAWRVFSLERNALDVPETSAAKVLTDGEREVIGMVVQAERLQPPAKRDRPFPPAIRSWVMLLCRVAGWRTSKPRPLPSNEVLRRANVQMQGTVRLLQATHAP